MQFSPAYRLRPVAHKLALFRRMAHGVSSSLPPPGLPPRPCPTTAFLLHGRSLTFLALCQRRDETPGAVRSDQSGSRSVSDLAASHDPLFSCVDILQTSGFPVKQNPGIAGTFSLVARKRLLQAGLRPPTENRQPITENCLSATEATENTEPPEPRINADERGLALQ